MDEYGRYLEAKDAICPACPVVCSGPLIVRSMLRWKAIYRGGRLWHWTREDIRAYLLHHFPRTVSFDPHLLGGAGPTVLISPLLAIMRNQIAAAERLGICAVTVNSTNRRNGTQP